MNLSARLNCADFALDIGFVFGLIFRIQNCVDKLFGYIRALNWLRPSATINFFVEGILPKKGYQHAVAQVSSLASDFGYLGGSPHYHACALGGN